MQLPMGNILATIHVPVGIKTMLLIKYLRRKARNDVWIFDSVKISWSKKEAGEKQLPAVCVLSFFKTIT